MSKSNKNNMAYIAGGASVTFFLVIIGAAIYQAREDAAKALKPTTKIRNNENELDPAQQREELDEEKKKVEKKKQDFEENLVEEKNIKKQRDIEEEAEIQRERERAELEARERAARERERAERERERAEEAERERAEEAERERERAVLEAERERAVLEAEIQTVESQKTELEADIQTAESQKTELEAELNKINNSIVLEQKRLGEKQSHIFPSMSGWYNKEGSIKSVEQQIYTKQQETLRKESEIKDIQTKISKIKEDLSNKQKEVGQLTERLSIKNPEPSSSVEIIPEDSSIGEVSSPVFIPSSSSVQPIREVLDLGEVSSPVFIPSSSSVETVPEVLDNKSIEKVDIDHILFSFDDDNSDNDDNSDDNINRNINSNSNNNINSNNASRLRNLNISDVDANLNQIVHGVRVKKTIHPLDIPSGDNLNILKQVIANHKVKVGKIILTSNEAHGLFDIFGPIVPKVVLSVVNDKNTLPEYLNFLMKINRDYQQTFSSKIHEHKYTFLKWLTTEKSMIAEFKPGLFSGSIYKQIMAKIEKIDIKIEKWLNLNYYDGDLSENKKNEKNKMKNDLETLNIDYIIYNILNIEKIELAEISKIEIKMSNNPVYEYFILLKERDYLTYLMVIYGYENLIKIIISILDVILNLEFVKNLLSELPFMIYDLLDLIITDWNKRQDTDIFAIIEDRIETVWIDMKTLKFFLIETMEHIEEKRKELWRKQKRKELSDDRYNPITIPKLEDSNLVFLQKLDIDVEKFKTKYNEYKKNNKNLSEFIIDVFGASASDSASASASASDTYNLQLITLIQKIFDSFDILSGVVIDEVTTKVDKQSGEIILAELSSTFYNIIKDFIGGIFETKILDLTRQTYIANVLTFLRLVHEIGVTQSISGDCTNPLYIILANSNKLPKDMKDMFEYIYRLYKAQLFFIDEFIPLKKGGRKNTNTRKKALNNVNNKTIKHIKYLTQETLKHLKHLKTLKKETRKVRL